MIISGRAMAVAQSGYARVLASRFPSQKHNEEPLRKQLLEILLGMDAVVCEEPLTPILLEKLVFEMAA